MNEVEHTIESAKQAADNLASTAQQLISDVFDNKENQPRSQIDKLQNLPGLELDLAPQVAPSKTQDTTPAKPTQVEIDRQKQAQPELEVSQSKLATEQAQQQAIANTAKTVQVLFAMGSRDAVGPVSSEGNKVLQNMLSGAANLLEVPAMKNIDAILHNSGEAIKSGATITDGATTIKTLSDLANDGSAVIKDLSNLAKDGVTILKDVPNLLKEGSLPPKDLSNVAKDGSTLIKDGSRLVKDSSTAAEEGMRVLLNAVKKIQNQPQHELLKDALKLGIDGAKNFLPEERKMRPDIPGNNDSAKHNDAGSLLKDTTDLVKDGSKVIIDDTHKLLNLLKKMNEMAPNGEAARQGERIIKDTNEVFKTVLDTIKNQIKNESPQEKPSPQPSEKIETVPLPKEPPHPEHIAPSPEKMESARKILERGRFGDESEGPPPEDLTSEKPIAPEGHHYHINPNTGLVELESDHQPLDYRPLDRDRWMTRGWHYALNADTGTVEKVSNTVPLIQKLKEQHRYELNPRTGKVQNAHSSRPLGSKY